ncbi:hypothetical protein GQX74_009415 [Glossina fuscipes]|nr:hypothetical protein GQX74_009415 [Glossina fuscipes]
MKHEKRWINTGNTSKHPNERHHLQPATSRAGQPKQEATAAIVTPQHHTTTPAPAIAVRTAQSMAFCQSPFHLMICYVCGMPGDYFLRNPAEGTRENRCRCPFHNMQQIQLNNAQTTITVVNHYNQLLPSSTAISDLASHDNQNELAKRTRINKNLSSQHSTRKSSRPHPPATTVTTNQDLHQ